VLQVVDLQKDENFQDLGVELLSISPDSVDAWREEGRETGIRDFDTVLTDPQNKVATAYGVMHWAVGGEPGHTFILVDESGEVAWLQDYGAMENGGRMYVVPQEVVREVSDHLRQ
jgi:alkyl hydroperoxide reductase subunit AhpC